MNFFKSHFALTRSQQNGIFILVLLIIILQVVLFSVDFYSGNEKIVNDEELEFFQKKLDSLHAAKNEVKKDTMYPFNPNFITDYKGYQLGMTVEEIDRLFAFRAQNKWVNSLEDFQKVTGVSDGLLKEIGIYFRFPEWTQKKAEVKATTTINYSKPAFEVADLNSATAEDLQKVNGIGEVLSDRIIKYRFRIGGFIDIIQLKDIYGLTTQVISNITERFQVLSRPQIQILNINSVNLAKLSEVPYFNYELARKVISYRNLHEKISSFEELSGIDAFPSDKIDRIRLYLTIE